MNSHQFSVGNFHLPGYPIVVLPLQKQSIPEGCQLAVHKQSSQADYSAVSIFHAVGGDTKMSLFTRPVLVDCRAIKSIQNGFLELLLLTLRSNSSIWCFHKILTHCFLFITMGNPMIPEHCGRGFSLIGLYPY